MRIGSVALKNMRMQFKWQGERRRRRMKNACEEHGFWIRVRVRSYETADFNQCAAVFIDAF